MVTLESSKLFGQLPPAELKRVRDTAREMSFANGQDIFKAGDPGDGVYIVKDGSVQIATVVGTGERHVFSRVPPGDVFGEMSLLDNQPRSAFASAEGDAVVYFVPREPMLELMRQSPELSMRLVQEVSGRLREFNRQYVRGVLQAERMALVGRFASSIVHDLKNPLCIISIAADVMAMPGATPEARATAQQRIVKQVERITNMVNDILEFTRGGQTTQAFGLVDFAAFIENLVEEFQAELELKSVKLALENPPPSVKLPMSPKRLTRVFYNLVANAVDAMPRGGTVKWRFQLNDTEVITEVEDGGPGIAPEIVDRLFEAFATFGKPKGTGLGLSIAQRIIQEHQGRIWARNPPGGGAVFAFALPRQRSSS
jgi:signal transduction histidine kinase